MSRAQHITQARALLEQSEQGTVPENDTAFVMIAQAQTHATLALVDAVRDLTDLMRHKR